MERQTTQLILDRFMSIVLHGRKSISSLMSTTLMEELSMEQFSLVRMIYEHGPIRASELADMLFVHRSAITVRVEKLVKKSLVVRERDEDDRRNVYLRLSEEGRELYESLRAKIYEFIEDIVQEIPKEEMENFLNVYEKIAIHIENYKEEE